MNLICDGCSSNGPGTNHRNEYTKPAGTAADIILVVRIKSTKSSESVLQ